MERFDAIVIGGGVIGTSIACHLARFGAGSVLLLERGTLGSGTSAQSSCIVRTHYSVPINVALSQSALAIQRGQGIAANELSVDEAQRIHPLLDLGDEPVIGWEPFAGYADAYLTLSAYVRAARRAGAVLREGVTVTGLEREGTRVTGVKTTQGSLAAGLVVSAQNMWSRELTRWLGIDVPLTLSRHRVMTLEAPTAYHNRLPVVMDWVVPGGIYFRCYGARQAMVGDTADGEIIPEPDNDQADVPLDHVADIGAKLAGRLPSFAEAGLAASWTGIYDTTPDWNPVLGPVPEIDGLMVAFGFSGHGFKLSPMVGRIVAQAALGIAPDLPLAPYSIERFANGRLLLGGYGASVVS